MGDVNTNKLLQNTKHKVTNLHSIPSSSTKKIVLRGDLIPYCHDDKSKENLSSNDATTTTTFNNNNSNDDNNNDNSSTTDNGVFQIQIVITTAKEGVYTLKLQRALYAKGKQFAEGSVGSNTTTTEECIGESTIESIIHNNEVLKSYYDTVSSVVAEANDTTECDGVTTTNGGTVQRNNDDNNT